MTTGEHERAHVYLDWNATTPPCAEALEAMREAAEQAWANPASVHGPGRRARDAVERAREAVAGLVGLDARDVVLTSGGTEANNLALRAALPPGRPPGALVASRIEHPSVTQCALRLAQAGVAVEWVDPAPDGRVEVAALDEAIRRAAERAPAGSIVVTLQAVNHETGVIQPIRAVATMVRERGAIFHVDAVQAVGRLEPSAWEGADLVSVASHKIRGPKGIGALVTRPGVPLSPLLYGGAQERGLRPGTQDPVACAGFAAAASRARHTPHAYAALAALRDRLEAGLARIGAAYGRAPERNGGEPRAPHVLNLSWPGLRGDELCAALDLEGVAVSSGSACSAGTSEPSPVLRAMVGEARAASAVRVSLGETTTLADVELAIARWERVLARWADAERSRARSG